MNRQLLPGREPMFKFTPPSGANVQALFRPFYAIGPELYYRMYFDLDKLPVVLWQ